MCIVNDLSEYIQRRLAGEHVLPMAHLLGMTAVEQEPTANELMVISIHHDDMSFYIYEIKESKFRISSFQENIKHCLSGVLTDDLLNVKTEAWWKAVFFEIGGQCSYDNAYDTLKIAEDNNQDFKELIDSVSRALKGLDFPSVPSVVCLVGEYSANPLVRYVLQEKLSLNNSIQLIPCDVKKNESFEDFPNQVIPPTEKIQEVPILVNGGIYADAILQKHVTVTFPLSCIDNVLVNDIKWNQLVSDKSPDYRTGNLEFKRLFLQADYDVFGDVFLSCKDIHGNLSLVKL